MSEREELFLTAFFLFFGAVCIIAFLIRVAPRI